LGREKLNPCQRVLAGKTAEGSLKGKMSGILLGELYSSERGEGVKYMLKN